MQIPFFCVIVQLKVTDFMNGMDTHKPKVYPIENVSFRDHINNSLDGPPW